MRLAGVAYQIGVLPTREELRSLVVMDDMTSTDGTTHIDTNYFPNTVASHKVDCAVILFTIRYRVHYKVRILIY